MAIPVNIIISIIAKANSFLTAGFRGELWAASFIGIDLSYKTGWLKFNKIGTASADTAASPYWLSANLKYRYVFTDKTTSPQLIDRVGYHIYDFSVNKSDSLYFNNYSYKGINIGLGAKIPFWESFGINVSGDYLPLLSVKEDPVDKWKQGKGNRLSSQLRPILYINRWIYCGFKLQL